MCVCSVCLSVFLSIPQCKCEWMLSSARACVSVYHQSDCERKKTMCIRTCTIGVRRILIIGHGDRLRDRREDVKEEGNNSKEMEIDDECTM